MWQGQLAARRRDGTLSFQLATLAPVHDGRGLTTGYVAIKRDPTRSGAQALGASRDRFRAMLNQAADALLVHDLNGRIADVNDCACRLLGMEKAEILARTADQFDVSRGRDELGARWAAVARSGAASTVESVWQDASGAPIDVELRMGPVSMSGEVFVLTLARDIRERRRAERAAAVALAELRRARDEAVAANRAKDEFLARMSHELRTPMNAIIGYSELILEELAERGQVDLADDVERIHGAGGHLLGLIDDVLDVSSLRVGKVELTRAVIDAPALAEEVVELMQPLAMAHGNVAVVEAGPQTHDLWADRQRIRQVLLNLVSNACKFTRDGIITVRVASGPSGIRLEVEDTGPGIPDDEQEAIFHAFEQSSREPGPTRQGTGLGLYISRQLCVLHGGTLTVRSRPGVGSCFTAWIPLMAGPAGRSSRHSRSRLLDP